MCNPGAKVGSTDLEVTRPGSLESVLGPLLPAVAASVMASPVAIALFPYGYAAGSSVWQDDADDDSPLLGGWSRATFTTRLRPRRLSRRGPRGFVGCERPQHPPQLPGIRRPQRPQELPFRSRIRRLRRRIRRLPARGQRDLIAPTVRRVGPAGHDPLVLERVEHRDHRGRVDAEEAGERLLRQRLARSEHPEDAELLAVEAVRFERGVRERHQSLLGVLEEVREELARVAGRRPLAGHAEIIA